MIQVAVFEHHNVQNQLMLLLHLNIRNVVYTVLLKLHITMKTVANCPNI